MSGVQRTDLAAFEHDLQEADKALVQAISAREAARRALNDRRAEDGLDLLEFTDNGEEADEESADDGSEDTEGRRGRRGK